MQSMRQKTVKMTARTALALCAVLAMLAGCSSAPAGNQAPAVHALAPVQQTTAADFAGKKLLLVGYRHDGAFIPLEPGHGSSTNIVFAIDGTLTGNSGFRIFSGTWKAGRTGSNGTRSCTIVIAPPKRGSPSNEKATVDTNVAIDAIAARFEKDLFNNLAAAKKLQKEKDFIRLLGSQDEVLLQFMFAESLTQD